MSLSDFSNRTALLSKFLQLLDMKENPSPEKLDNYFPKERGLIGHHSGKVFVRLSKWAYKDQKDWHLVGKEVEFKEAWEHPLLVNWWSDELVEIGKQLNETDFIFRLALYLDDICVYIGAERPSNHYPPAIAVPIMLESILNTYGRSLNDE